MWGTLRRRVLGGERTSKSRSSAGFKHARPHFYFFRSIFGFLNFKLKFGERRKRDLMGIKSARNDRDELESAATAYRYTLRMSAATSE